MRREVLDLLMNDKVTYIEFQGDLWVTLTLGFSYSKVTFVFSFSQSDPWNLSSLLITIITENVKTLQIPHFCILHKTYSSYLILLMRIKSLIN